MAYSEFAMKTAGVDFASQNKNTAVCIINWDRGDLGVESVCTGIDDDFVRALAANVNHLGIDIPLGWPIAFSDAVHDYVHGKPCLLYTSLDRLRDLAETAEREKENTNG